MARHFRELTERDAAGRPVANVFVMGSASEILRVFDIGIAFPEIYALQAATWGVSLQLIDAAENAGYSSDICGYVKTDVGQRLLGCQSHPAGTLPKPALAVAPNTCNTYIKWAEIWGRMYGIPVFVLDLPGLRGNGVATPGDAGFAADRAYVVGQLQELIALCEQLTGRAFDIDRLREGLGHVNAMARLYAGILELNKARPAPFSALRDGSRFLGIANAYRGTPEGVAYFELAQQELAARVAAGACSIPDGGVEIYRLLFVGTPCYSHFNRFLGLFERWGGVFAHNEYLAYASGGLGLGTDHDLDHPLESMAEQMLLASRNAMSRMFFSQDWQRQVVEDWGLDGICYHGVKSCRTVSTGMADAREYQMRRHGIPGLTIESDLVDPRLWSEAQMRNRVDAFFELLASRRGAA